MFSAKTFDFFEKYWQKFCYDGYPRDALIPINGSQKFGLRKINNEDELREYIVSSMGIHNAFVTHLTLGMLEIKPNIVNKLYIDLDGVEEQNILKIPWIECRKAQEYFRKKFGAKARMYFSGCRGFALYIDIEPVQLQNPRDSIRSIVDEMMKETGILTTMDNAVLGDVRRLVRPPFTINIKSGMMTVPVTISSNITEIMQLAAPNFYLSEKYKEFERDFEALLKRDIVQSEQLSKELQNADEKIVMIKQELGARNGEFKPCQGKEKYKRECILLETVVAENLRNQSDGRHRILHFYYIPRLISLGADDQEVYTKCKQWVESTKKDWGQYESYVMNSIKRTRRDSWLPWGLESLLIEYPDLVSKFQKR